MAKSAKNITVKATPGRNVRLDPVVRLEDLLQKMQQAPAPKAAGAGKTGAARQLVVELESHLRALRGPVKKAKK